MNEQELRDFFTYRAPTGHIVELHAEERQFTRRVITATLRSTGDKMELPRLGIHDGSEEEALMACALQVAISYPRLTPIRELKRKRKEPTA